MQHALNDSVAVYSDQCNIHEVMAGYGKEATGYQILCKDPAV